MMKKNHRRLISTLLIALMLDSQLTTSAWAENMMTVDVMDRGGNHKKHGGGATLPRRIMRTGRKKTQIKMTRNSSLKKW